MPLQPWIKPRPTPALRCATRPAGRSPPEIVNRKDLSGRGDLGTGPLGLLGNVLWFLVAGWWLAIGHLSSALACFVSIVGIPFGIQHIKLALIALKPVGMTVVPVRSAG